MYYLGKGIQNDQFQSFFPKDISVFEEEVNELMDKHLKNSANISAGFEEFKAACHHFCHINKSHIEKAENLIKDNDLESSINVLNNRFGEMTSFPDAKTRMNIRERYGDEIMPIVRDMVHNLNSLSFKVYEQRDEVVKELENSNPDFELVFEYLHNMKEELCY